MNSYQPFKLTNGSVSHRKKIYRLRTNRKPPFFPDEFGQSHFGRANRRSTWRTNDNWFDGKTEPMKTFDSSNQSEKNPALVFFKFKIHHFFNNSRSERGRIVDFSLYYWLFIIYVINIYHSLFEGKSFNIFFFFQTK